MSERPSPLGYLDSIRDRIEGLRREGITDFAIVLQRVNADPRQLYGIWKDLGGATAKASELRSSTTPGIGSSSLPVEDSERAQWWFTPTTTDWLCEAITRLLNETPKQSVSNHVEGSDPENGSAAKDTQPRKAAPTPTFLLTDSLSEKLAKAGSPVRVVTLGTPSVALALSRHMSGICCLDADSQVIDAVYKRAKNVVSHTYDVADNLPTELSQAAEVVVMDPPWYSPDLENFIHRALELCRIPGHVITSLPSKWTREDAEEQKQKLISALTGGGLQVRLYHRDQLEYSVPSFERRAFEDIPDFHGIPWRRADVLHLAVENREWRTIDKLTPSGAAIQTHAFARDDRYFRVFLSSDSQHYSPDTALPSFTAEPAFRTEISRRKIDRASYNIWTSHRRAGRVSNFELATLVLEEWRRSDVETKGSRASAIRRIIDKGIKEDIAAGFVESIDNELELWTRFHSRKSHRNDEEIMRAKEAMLSPLAVKQMDGDVALIRRAYTDPSDTYRGAFQRDRDRVLWSKSLRRLASKTQLFPTERNDQLRQRLAHSLEVLQLATTISDSFGLNRDLVEAGALAHDIGHTPFGHAGEHALDELLYDMNTALGGFNHYEHGVDVVRYLDDAYQTHSDSGHLGLNLTSDVCECIFKHGFFHIDEKSRPDRRSLWESSKHQSFLPRGNPHLEGQAIRTADKVSYLVSDLEDGILLGAIRREDLLACRLFHFPPIDFRQGDETDLHAEFLVQRRNLIQVLMEDVIVASESRLSRFTRPEVCGRIERHTIDHSDEMSVAVNEVWDRIQKRRLHQDARVIMANLRASRIVKELTILFAVFPNLIDVHFEHKYRSVRNSEYMAWYKSHAGEVIRILDDHIAFLPLNLVIDFDASRKRELPTELLIQAKDYVASLTDAEAKFLHYKFIAAYSDRT